MSFWTQSLPSHLDPKQQPEWSCKNAIMYLDAGDPPPRFSTAPRHEALWALKPR